LPKGDFKPPFEKGGRGDFSSLRVRHFWFMSVWFAIALLNPL
jgi:hypothetical protein